MIILIGLLPVCDAGGGELIGLKGLLPVCDAESGELIGLLPVCDAGCGELIGLNGLNVGGVPGAAEANVWVPECAVAARHTAGQLCLVEVKLSPLHTTLLHT